MPAGDPGAYMKQGMSPQQAMQKAGAGGGMARPGGAPPGIQRPPGQAGGGGAVQNLMSQFRRIVQELQKVGALGMAKAEMDKIGGGAPVSPKPAMPGRAVAGGARPMGGAPSGMMGGPVPKPGGMAGGPPKMGMM